MPLAAAVPMPDAPRGRLRLGLLQSRQPFIDPYDIPGSRERAFSAYRVLIRRSLEEQGPLHWLAGGAFPLSGPGPFPAGVLEQLALTERSAEVSWLRSFARRHRLRLTLGGWWQDTGTHVANRLLTVDSRGQCQVSRPNEHGAGKDCGCKCQRRTASSRYCQVLPPSVAGSIAMAHGSKRFTDPHCLRACARRSAHGSAIVGPDGALLAHAGVQTEGCLVAEIG